MALSVEVYTGTAINSKEKIKIRHPNGEINFEFRLETKHFGVGAVLPHMDVEVYGEKTYAASRYPIDGWDLKFGAQRKIFLAKKHAIFVESAILYSRIPSTQLTNGSAEFGNKSIHFTAGYYWGLPFL